jgi:hypothetical protein
MVTLTASSALFRLVIANADETYVPIDGRLPDRRSAWRRRESLTPAHNMLSATDMEM